jgi:hypothetical protein
LFQVFKDFCHQIGTKVAFTLVLWNQSNTTANGGASAVLGIGRYLKNHTGTGTSCPSASVNTSGSAGGYGSTVALLVVPAITVAVV